MKQEFTKPRKNKSMKTISFLLVLAILSNFVKAADFIDTTIISNEVEYNFLISIPDDFNSTELYSLVVGLQPCLALPTSNYRAALSFLTDSLNLIIVCPDLSATDNWMSDDNYGVITTCIDSAMAMYPINPELVYLTGMSCNGASTLQEGLKKVYPFKGIFPYAPYIPSIDPEIIDLDSDLPVTISVGTNDSYLAHSLNVYDSLKQNGANVNLVLIEGITHSYEFENFGNEMIHSFHYLHDTNSISIAYSEGEIPDFNILNTDAAIELNFTITNEANKELILNCLSSKPSVVANPEITYTPEDGTAILRFEPTADKKGKATIVLEAKEINGTSYEQITFKIEVNKAVSVMNNNSKEPINIYPNPASDKIFINTHEESSVIGIYNISGVCVMNLVPNAKQAINISTLKPGMYFVKQVNSKGQATTKVFIKQI